VSVLFFFATKQLFALSGGHTALRIVQANAEAIA